MPWSDTKMSRRKFLKLAGSGIAIVVVGGTVWRAFSNGVFSSGHGQPMNLGKIGKQNQKKEQDLYF
jgi:hypothetical protein